MSGVGIQWTIDDSPLREHLARLSAVQFDSATSEIGAYMLRRVQENFLDQTLWSGAPMPRSAAAIARSGQTLMDSRALRQSYTWNLIAGGVEIGTNLVYGAIHHFGGQAGRGHRTTIVARQVLGVSPEDEREIGEIVMDELRSL